MKKVVSVILICIFLQGCATFGSQTSSKTQLQVREFQTRTYETKDTLMVMKALVNVLQDEGFIIQNANTELGLITASKESEIGTLLSRIKLQKNKTAKNKIIECSVNVSDFGQEQIRVRVNFQSKILDYDGNVKEVKPVEDGQYYQDFFAKVDKGLFLQKQKI